MNKFREFVNRRLFKNFILGVIIFNSLLLGIMTIKNLNETFYNILKYIDLGCLIIYILEMLLKLFAYGIIGYFKDLWNWFDFIIIIISIFSEFTTLSSIKIMRSLKIFRSLKSFRGLKIISSVNTFEMIISSIGKALPDIAWISLLIFIMFYVYAIIGVNEFGNDFPDWFGTIPKAFYSLFIALTYQTWLMSVNRPILEKYPYAWIYFISFLFSTVFTLFNTVVAIVYCSIYDVATATSIGKKDEDEKEVKKEIICESENVKLELDSIRNTINELQDLIKEGKLISLIKDSEKDVININKIDQNNV